MLKRMGTVIDSAEQMQWVKEYETGEYSVAMLAKAHGVSTGKMYYLLRDAGCNFTRKRRKPVTPEERANRSRAYKGKTVSEKQRQLISEANSCNYNGLNGWGHVKRLPNGYVIAYAPKHPKAHKDGYVLLHRLVVEFQLGRYLEDGEVVHHMNHIRDDNRIENLILMNRKEHMSMHMKERHAERKRML